VTAPSDPAAEPDTRMNTEGTRPDGQGTAERVDRVVPLRRPGRWVVNAVVLVLIAWVVNAAVTNDELRWDVVGTYLFSPLVLNGLYTTVQLAVLSMIGGTVLGVALALMRLSENPLLRAISVAYAMIFRGVPVIVLLLFWFFLSALIPELGLGIPFGPTFVSAPTNEVISQLGAALLAFALHEAAYMSEIVRGGILSVPRGQQEAADALGMSRAKTFRRIVFPQAMRVILPPAGNQFITLLKTTSLVLVVALPDLMTTVTQIYARNFQQIPLLIVASTWYLVCVGILSLLQSWLEQRFGQGVNTPTTSRRRRGLSRSAIS
jgi:polar amino acid transport system permease protein